MFAFSEELRAHARGQRRAACCSSTPATSGPNSLAASTSDDLRYAVGAGLRYQTPVGPIRFDFGYQLNPIPACSIDGEPQTRRWRMHFSIGQAF